MEHPILVLIVPTLLNIVVLSVMMVICLLKINVISNYIDSNDGGPVNEDEIMSVAKVDNANTLKSCKEHCNIFDTCGGIAYKKGSNDECYTMSTSQSWLSRDNILSKLKNEADILTTNQSSKAYGRNYKCIKRATFDNRNLTTT
jgi:hypothetical protein